MLLIAAALVSAIASLSAGSSDAGAKSVTAVLSGGNLPAQISIPSEGLLEEAMAARQALFAPLSEIQANTSTYAVGYTLRLQGIGYTTDGTYFPRAAPDPGLWAAGFHQEHTYVATPEWDHVLKIYLVAALSGQDPATVPASAVAETSAVPAFDRLMRDSGVKLVTWEEAKRLLPPAPVDATQGSARESGDGSAGGNRSGPPIGFIPLAVLVVALIPVVVITVRRRHVRVQGS